MDRCSRRVWIRAFSAQPIMIEAVPLSSGSIRITITKVHAPEKGEDLIPSITTPLGLGIPSLGGSPEEEIPAAAPKAAPLPYNLFGFPDFHTLRETSIPDSGGSESAEPPVSGSADQPLLYRNRFYPRQQRQGYDLPSKPLASILTNIGTRP